MIRTVSRYAQKAGEEKIYRGEVIFEGKIESREDLYRQEVFSTINYFKLRKIKRLIEENQRELENNFSGDEQMVLLQMHQHLKKTEIGELN